MAWSAEYMQEGITIYLGKSYLLHGRSVSDSNDDKIDYQSRIQMITCIAPSASP